MKQQLETWKEIYGLLSEIGQFDPWEYTREKDVFIYLRKENDRPMYFSFISDFTERYDVIHQYGRPKELLVGDRELLSILSSLCKLIGIPVQFKRSPPQISEARNSMIDVF